MFDSDLIIKGGAFGAPTRLKGILSKRMNITYGRNGSGKSTIARAFREQQPDRQAKNPGRNYSLSFDGSGSLKPEISDHVFVFNEDFIDDNIRIGEGLRSIIRIGASAELDGPIQAARANIEDLKQKQEPVGYDLDVLNGSASKTGSIKEADKEIKDSLKKKGGFISRLDRIEGKDHNLVASLYRPILNYDKNDKLPVSIGDASRHLDNLISRYLSLKSGTSITWNAPDYSALLDLNTINDLLSQTVRPAELSDDERAILDELSKELASENFIPKTQSLIIESTREFCPLCHQPVSSQHKHMLEQRLIKFRDKTVREFKEMVYQITDGISELNCALPSFPTSDYADDITDAEAKLRALNVFHSKVRETLEKKQANPFAQIDAFDRVVYTGLVKECQDSLARIAEDVDAYNQKLSEKDSLRAEIDKLNVQLAYHENKTLVDEYNARVSRESDLQKQFNDLERKIQEQREIIASLKSMMDQVDDAREQINHYLDLVFGINKLRLAPAGKDKYKLQIKNGDSYVDIPPKSISSGERNALALAYFFACVLEKKDQNYDYSDPTLLVIDDPVSSFDAENKAGVISLIACQCKKVLDGNKESKVLVLTHDHTTLRDLCSLRQNKISPKDFDLKLNGSGVEWNYYSLTPNHTLRRVNCNFILENMEYGDDLWAIFSFASQEDPDNYEGLDGIGNTIRRFAESYATHMYKCKWYELFSDDRHLNCLPNESLKETIQAFAVRNVLNSESHGTTECYSPVEIQRSARVLLTYIYYADPRHLRAYLVGRRPENEKHLETIRGWFA